VGIVRIVDGARCKIAARATVVLGKIGGVNLGGGYTDAMERSRTAGAANGLILRDHEANAAKT
jgi:hypothetical protein